MPACAFLSYLILLQSLRETPPSTGKLLFKDKKQTAIFCVVESGHAHVKYKHMLQTASESFKYCCDLQLFCFPRGQGGCCYSQKAHF